MIATVEYVERCFDEFNRQMFGGALPKLPVVMSRSRSYLGACVFKRRRSILGKVRFYDFKLRISNRLDLPENVIDDVIIHEMIHYYIGVNQLNDTSAHGRLFRQMMNSINERYGRHVSISHKLTPEQSGSLDDGKRRWRVVAVLRLADGRVGVKVLPHIVQRIVAYFNAADKSPEVADVRICFSDDTFFGKFPCSSAFKVHFVDETDLSEHLAGSRSVECDGRRLHLLEKAEQ